MIGLGSHWVDVKVFFANFVQSCDSEEALVVGPLEEWGFTRLKVH